MTPWLSRLALRFVQREVAEFIAGDLEEEFAARVARDGALRARAWHFNQALRAMVFVPRRIGRRDVAPRKGDGFVRTLFQDLRHGLRLLFKTPGYTAAVIVTLALAIGANSVIFSFANVLLIKPLPIADPETLGWIYVLDPQRATVRGRSSYPDFDDLRRASRSFATLSASAGDNVTMTEHGEPQRMLAQKVSASLFDTWGLKPILGRALLAAEDVPGAPCALVLSHKVWKAQFQSDPGIVEQSLTIDGRPCAVAGVLDPAIEFGNLARTDIWMPIALDPAAVGRDDRRYSVVGRLAPGVTHEQADAELKTIMARLSAEHPDTNREWSARVAPTKEAIAGGDTWVILALLGLIVGFVLLIACANLANLALARTASRRRELAVRAALGATRWRVVRQLVTESLMLGVAGGLAGLVVADAGLRIMRAAAFEPIFELIVVDRNVMLFGAALSIASPILFTLLPALYASGHTLGETLKEGGRGAGAIRTRRSRHALVVAQVSLALTLLVVSTLVVRSMIAMSRVSLGFDPDPLLVARLEPPKWKHGTDDRVARMQEELLSRIRRVPGVEAAAVSSGLPVLSPGSRTTFDIAGRTAASTADRPWAMQITASDDFFRATGIPVLTGRAFEPRDRLESEPVAIVTADTARRYWGSPSAAIGARLAVVAAPGAEQVWRRVVAVVGDIRSEPIPDISSEVQPQLYVPAAQRPSTDMGLIVRSPRAADLSAAIRAAVREADADTPVFQMRTMQKALADELASSRIITGMFVAFAVLALVLATTGLYAVIAYSVGQRTQEIAIRIALGALPGDIPRLVLTQGIRLVAIGGAIGLAGAFVVSRMVREIFYGVSPSDPLTYAGVVGAVLVSSVLAMWIPSRRASRINPVTSLRAG